MFTKQNIYSVLEDVVRARLMAHPPWRQLLIVSVVLPMVVVLAVCAFAWPTSQVRPRELPVGVVGSDAATEQVLTALDQSAPGAYDLRIYADEDAAEQAIEAREVYGALAVSRSGVSVLTSTAASPTVARLLTDLAGTMAARTAQGDIDPPVRMTDVVAADPDDPNGAVLSSALLPLSICSLIIAAVVALLLEFGPAWRMTLALVCVSALAGLGVYAVGQWWLGVLPGEAVATWAALALLVLAMSSTTAGLISLVGSPGLGIGAAIMVFIGNPFSGTTSAPELLPDIADHVGQWLPPGAGANLVRSTTYFGGSGAEPHVLALLVWVAFGLGAIASGHRSFTGFAARRQRARAAGHGAVIATRPST
ncbi:hypothetical protein ACVW2K_004382 [Nocardioides sp. HB32]